MMKKLIALVLALLMIVAVFVGCAKKRTNVGDQDDNDDTTTAETTADGAGDESSEGDDEGNDDGPNDTAIDDDWSIEEILDPDNWEGSDIPEDVDYNGYKFKVLADTSCNISQYEFLVESSGDIITDKVTERREYVEDYLGIEFEIIEFGGGYDNMQGYANEIETASDAGTPYDLSVSYNLIPPIVASKGLSRDLAESDSLNLLETQKPYWGSGIKEEIMIKDRIFWMSDNASWTSIRSMTCIFVNIEFFERVNEGWTKKDLYNMVDNKTWTMENMLGFCQNAYSDANLNDIKDENDEFGIVAGIDRARVDLWLYSAGLRYTRLNSKGTYDWTLGDSVEVQFINWWQEKLHSSNDIMSAINNFNPLNEGRTMFGHAPVYATESNLDYAYTVLPMPFYNSNVKNNYSTALCNDYGSYLIPRATKTEAFERSATVLELLAAGGNKYIAPAYFGVYLKRNQAAGDPDMMRMFNVIRNSIVFDLGYLYGSVLTYTGTREVFLALRGLWASGSSNITTEWAGMKATVTTKLNDLMTDIVIY